MLALLLATLPAYGAPNGKTSTGELGVAGGAVVLFLTYESALLRSKGSVKQGEQVMRSPTYAYDFKGGSYPLSLRQIRGLVMRDVAFAAPSSTSNTWRTKFENFRACWNTSLALAAAPKAAEISNPESRQERATDAPPTKTPAPKNTSTPKPPTSPSCAALIADVLQSNEVLALAQTLADPNKTPAQAEMEQYWRNKLTPLERQKARVQALDKKVDLIDLSNALANTQSLFAQVQNKTVGTHLADNYLRARFLTIAGVSLLNLIDANAPAEVGTQSTTPNSELQLAENVATDCYAKFSPLDCVTRIAQIEGSLQTAQEKRDACAFDRHVWMPSFTVIEAWGTMNAAGASSPSSLSVLIRVSGGTWLNASPPPSRVPLDTYVANPGKASQIDMIDDIVLGSPPDC